MSEQFEPSSVHRPRAARESYRVYANACRANERGPTVVTFRVELIYTAGKVQVQTGEEHDRFFGGVFVRTYTDITGLGAAYNHALWALEHAQCSSIEVYKILLVAYGERD